MKTRVLVRLLLVAGLFGLIAYFAGNKDEREPSTLVWSILITIIGFLLLIEMVFTMKAITIVFGIIVAAVGLVLLLKADIAIETNDDSNLREIIQHLRSLVENEGLQFLKSNLDRLLKRI